jgi:L-alanine-DL-glutamate epimerase-like enolase superfamily enzyme
VKITGVRLRRLRLPLDPPFVAAWDPEPRRAFEATLVLVDTDEGLTGIGSGDTMDGFERWAPLFVGRDPLDLERHVRVLETVAFHASRFWPFEAALWDLAGKARGVPVHALLGGLVQRSVRAYASLPRYGAPSDVARAAAAMVGQGFSAIKLHQTDVASVAAAREAVGDGVELMLDTNCPWTVEEAVAMARRLEPYRLRWLEEPVWPPEDYAGLARVRAATATPIATGENEATVFGFREILRAGAADVVQPSITKVGGLLELKKIAILAAAAGVTLVPHSYYYGPGLAATLHAVACTPGVPYVEYGAGELAPSLMLTPLRCVDGRVGVDDRPGLGADPDPDVIARHPYSPERARPFSLA